jgi:phosphoglycolate phosphatase-like HAD superfamily hydrolase
MIRCIVFDFDGTLVRSNEIKLRSYYQAVEPIGCPREIVDAVLAAPAPGDRYQVLGKIVAQMAGRGRLPDNRPAAEWVRKLSGNYSALCEKAIATCPEVTDAEGVLGWLRARRYGLYLNSATPRRHLQRLVGLRSLDRYFAGVYGGPDSKEANLLAIFINANVEGEEVLTIGDGDDDRQAAAATGCHFAGLTDPGSTKPVRFVPPPLHTLGGLPDIKQVIASIDRHSLPPEDMPGQPQATGA